jgi:hypothetical protein
MRVRFFGLTVATSSTGDMAMIARPSIRQFAQVISALLAIVVVLSIHTPLASAQSSKVPTRLTLQLTGLTCLGKTDEHVKGEWDNFTLGVYALDIANPRLLIPQRSPAPTIGLGACDPSGSRTNFLHNAASFSFTSADLYPRIYAVRLMLVELDSGSQILGYARDFNFEESKAEQQLFDEKQRLVRGYNFSPAAQTNAKKHLEWVKKAAKVAMEAWSLISPLLDWWSSRDDRFSTRQVGLQEIPSRPSVPVAGLPRASAEQTTSFFDNGVWVKLHYRWVLE